MTTHFSRFLCALCALALLLVPVATLAEGEQDAIAPNIGSDPKAWFVVPDSGFDTDDMYLNGIPYTPEINLRSDLIMRTGDLLAAKVIGELPNIESTAFQIKNGKISLNISVNVPDDGEETETATVFAGNGLRTWLRSGPDGKRLRLCNDGTTVTVLSRGDAWCKVRIGNDTGYIMTKYLQFATNSGILSNAQQVLKNANPFQLKGGVFELSDGLGNKQSITPSNVWQSPIVKEVDPNEVVLPPDIPALPEVEQEEEIEEDIPDMPK